MEEKRPSQAPAKPAGRQIGELERLGPNGRDVLVLGLGAPGFDDLPRNQKILAYHLYRAAIAGNDIMYEQNHRHALEIKSMLEAIHIHAQDAPDPIREAVHDYLKYIWIHHGNYHHYSHTKFVPNQLTPDALREAARLAAARGAVIDLSPGESLDEKLDRLMPFVFDADLEKLQSNQTDHSDIIATSAVNFYDRGITKTDIDALPLKWRHKLNVRFARENGRIVPQTFKVGGMFGRDLETICCFLRLAIPYCESENQRRSVELLIDFYHSGDEDRFRQHSIEWLNSRTTIDYLNGFVEQYIDPRGIIGNYCGNVSVCESNALAERIAANSRYFEAKMPWPDRFKRPNVDPPVVLVVNVLVETGDSGPVSPAAYNLPNYNDIRRDHGSKNVILLNVEKTTSEKLIETIVNEFYLPEYREKVLRYGRNKVRPLEVSMHEILGHGSGQPDPSLGQDPRSALGRVYAAVEECRADLVALYHVSDPKLVEIGAFAAEEQADIVETAYITYTQGWLLRYDRVVDLCVREAHNQAHELILSYLVENGGTPGRDFGFDVIERDGNFFARVRDVERMRQGLGELLEKLQVMKSTGDAEGAAALFDRFGSRVDPAWHRNIVARLQRLNIPKLKAFVFPRLEPLITKGEVVDVRIHYDEDLTTQQLRFSRLRRRMDIEAD